MYPVIFQVGDFPLRSFSVLVMAGFLLGTWLWARLLAKHGRDPRKDPARSGAVAMWLLIGVIGGARLAYVAVESAGYLTADLTPGMERFLAAEDRAAVRNEISLEDLEAVRPIITGHDFLHDPLSILFIWEGGLVMYGGMFGAILLGLWSAKRQGMHPWNALDTGLIAGMIGQAVGRWGCLLVGDDYGSVVPESMRELPFPLTITVPDKQWLIDNPESLFEHSLAGEVLWATQPWMSFNALAVGLAGLYVLQRAKWWGAASIWILFHYSISRFVIEMFRGDSIRGLWFDGAISTSQLVSIPGALAAIVLWFVFKDKAPRIDAPTSA